MAFPGDELGSPRFRFLVVGCGSAGSSTDFGGGGMLLGGTVSGWTSGWAVGADGKSVGGRSGLGAGASTRCCSGRGGATLFRVLLSIFTIGAGGGPGVLESSPASGGRYTTPSDLLASSISSRVGT